MGAEEIHGIRDWRSHEFTGYEKPDDVLALLTKTCTCCGLAQPWGHVSLTFGLCKDLLRVAGNAKTEDVAYREDKTDPGSDEKLETVHDCFLLDKLRELPGSQTSYNNLSRLKLWGFLRQDRRWRSTGIYQITAAGKNFLRSRDRVPRSLIAWRDEELLAWKNAELVTFQEACRTNFSEVADYLQDWLGKNPGREGELF